MLKCEACDDEGHPDGRHTCLEDNAHHKFEPATLLKIAQLQDHLGLVDDRYNDIEKQTAHEMSTWLIGFVVQISQARGWNVEMLADIKNPFHC